MLEWLHVTEFRRCMYYSQLFVSTISSSAELCGGAVQPACLALTWPSEGVRLTSVRTHVQNVRASIICSCAQLVCRGREAGVPHMVLDALRRTELRSCKQRSRHAQKALRIIRVSMSIHLCMPQTLCHHGHVSPLRLHQALRSPPIS